MSYNAHRLRFVSMYGASRNPTVTRTSSRIFFQMILVISSPSSSTTGFATAIFVSGGHYAERKITMRGECRGYARWMKLTVPGHRGRETSLSQVCWAG
jgi:hypothetical protein